MAALSCLVIGLLGGGDCRLAVSPCDLVDVVRTDKAQITEEPLGLLLGASCGDGLPSICNAVIGLNVGGDHGVVLVELCLVCPDTLPSESNHPHFLTIGLVRPLDTGHRGSNVLVQNPFFLH